MTSMKPGGEDALASYLGVVGPLMERAGAKLISRHEVSGNLSESELPQFVSLTAYPGTEAIQLVFANQNYLALKQVRQDAFSRYDVCVLD